MAKVKIQGHASGTGVFTVTAPNSNTDRVITLPDGDVTMGVGIDDNANATAITIDSSENVMVTKTSLNDAVVGVELRANGIVVGSADGNVGAVFNRNSSDGDIIAVKKGGTTVGSIFSGHGASQVGIGTNTTGITFNPSTRSMMPADPSSTSPQLDATLDIGHPSVRWKDLYLSGGLKVGGTAAANTLDDYEEGTWTTSLVPASGSYSYTYGNTGYYTKIGNIVHISAWIHLTVASAVSGSVYLAGLPFTVNSSSRRWLAIGGYNHSSVAQSSGMFLALTAGSTNSNISYNSDTITTQVTATSSNLGSGAELYINGSYQVA